MHQRVLLVDHPRHRALTQPFASPPAPLRRRSFTAAAVAAVAFAAARSRKAGPPPAPLIYVTDEEGGLVVAVEPRRAQVVARIPVGKRPRGAKVSRDGKQLFVALSGSPRGGPGIDESTLPPPDRGADGSASST